MGNSLNKIHLPGETIGIIGGGQLGQMMAASAKEKGFKVLILDPTPNCPAAQVSDGQIVSSYDDLSGLIKLAKKCDVLTYEFENVDAETISEVKKYTDVPQGTKALIVTQNRIREKSFLEDNRFPVVKHAIVNSYSEFTSAIESVGIPAILKTVEGGYDGKGQLRIEDDSFSENEVQELLTSGTCILEAQIDLLKEVSVVISGNSNGEQSVFPVIENEHRNNILHISNCPAFIKAETEQECYQIAAKIASGLNLVGTMCVEFFIDTKHQVYVNEIAPRPHNSGHLTIEACNLSQFDTHILGVCGWKMPKVKLFESAIMVNLLGQHLQPAKDAITKHVDWYFHDYGKAEAKHNRKMGHITILTDNIELSKLQIQNDPIWDK